MYTVQVYVIYIDLVGIIQTASCASVSEIIKQNTKLELSMTISAYVTARGKSGTLKIVKADSWKIVITTWWKGKCLFIISHTLFSFYHSRERRADGINSRIRSLLPKISATTRSNVEVLYSFCSHNSHFILHPFSILIRLVCWNVLHGITGTIDGLTEFNRSLILLVIKGEKLKVYSKELFSSRAQTTKCHRTRSVY